MARCILHVDMDEFFVAVERLDDPSLRGKCVLVGGSAAGRGVISTASYEARRFGCHSAMPTARALRLCPQAVLLPVRGQRYREVSQSVFEMFRRFTPTIEPLSIDEAFLDVTGSVALFGPGEQIARQIKAAIGEELGLVASVGVAGNKFLAKLASDLDKPDGLVVVPADGVAAFLAPLPIEKLWGVGRRTAEQLRRRGVTTFGQLAAREVEHLRGVLGNEAERFVALARGLDDRPVVTDSQAKSIGQEETFAEDIGDPQALREVLLGQAQQVARRLRASGKLARTVTVKLRSGDFQTHTRSRTLSEPTDLTEPIWTQARALFEEWWATHGRSLRLLGVTVSQFAEVTSRQLNLFDQDRRDRQGRVDKTLDTIVEKFGPDSIRRGHC